MATFTKAVSASGQSPDETFALVRVPLEKLMESEINMDGRSAPQASQRRREIFERTRARYAATGIFLDDPEYLTLIAKWIEGEITMTEVALRWHQGRQGGITR